MTGVALIVQGDTLHLPLPDASVDTIITSPPYLWKRKYAIEGTGELGNERNWREYLDNLWTVTDEMLRVLKPKGSIFVNLGDTRVAGREPKWLGVPPKSRLLLPERYRVGCQDRYLAQGVIVRQVQIWEKANGLPESTVDRTRDSHEDFVHLVKQPRYYSATDEIREPHAAGTIRNGQWQRGVKPRAEDGSGADGSSYRAGHSYADEINPLGKLPGSVWSIGDSIWDGPIRFCPRCGRDLTAGNGSAGRIPRDMVSIGSPTSASDEPPGSPTNSTSDPSPTDSPSTTSAATEDASGPTTSKPSPSASTSTEVTPQQPETPPRPTATTGTSSTRPTPTPGLGVRESARCVCETVSEHDGPGSVWSVPSEPLRLPDHLGVQHYAAFPSEWPRRLILGWSPPGICVECGQGRVPVVERELEVTQHSITATYKSPDNRRSTHFDDRKRSTATILGYACPCAPYTDHPGTGEYLGPDQREAEQRGTYSIGFGHGRMGARPRVGPWREWHLDRWTPPPTRPAVVLDCFGGTGTTAMVAKGLGRIGISVDLSHAYGRAARWRTQHDGAKAISRTNLERQGQLL